MTERDHESGATSDPVADYAAASGADLLDAAAQQVAADLVSPPRFGILARQVGVKVPEDFAIDCAARMAGDQLEEGRLQSRLRQEELRDAVSAIWWRRHRRVIENMLLLSVMVVASAVLVVLLVRGALPPYVVALLAAGTGCVGSGIAAVVRWRQSNASSQTTNAATPQAADAAGESPSQGDM